MHFPGRQDGRDGPIPWPPRSPNITPLDLSLWGCVKDIVYNALVTFLDELNLRIVAAIETVTQQMLKNTWRQIEYLLDIYRIHSIYNRNFEYTTISHIQFYFIMFDLKIIATEIPTII
jgi:hypothetical protein